MIRKMRSEDKKTYMEMAREFIIRMPYYIRFRTPILNGLQMRRFALMSMPRYFFLNVKTKRRDTG